VNLTVPFGRVVGIPGEVVSAIKLLPLIARNTGDMSGNTADMAADTSQLPDIQRSLEALAKEMSEVAETTKVLPGMDGRMATIEEAMPVLVEVQRHLARVPDILEHLDERIGLLSASLDQLLRELEDLGHNVNALSGAVGPLGRIAGRLPGRNRS
jgi:methyl-accepting chemotaxis protein